MNRMDDFWQAEVAYMKFAKLHARNSNDGLRLGQRFVNMYIKKPWPELFYMSNYDAFFVIYNWLVDNQYFDELPPVVNPAFLENGELKK